MVKNSANNNTKPIWDALNIGKTKKKSSSSSSTLTSKDLNNHFSTIADILGHGFRKENHSKNTPEIRDNILPTNSQEKFLSNFKRFTPASICLYLKSFSDKKSTGPDGISVMMLKKTLPFVVNILTDIFNQILIEGDFPKCWKTARVTPVFKGGDPNDPSNYRPISILPILSKIFEKHINKCLMTFLTDIKAIHPLQSGFRSNYSCSDAVHKVVSDVLHQKQKNRCVIGMFLDFCKAFDCVNHDILFNKLASYKIIGPSLKLIKSFLDDRQQYVFYNQIASEKKPINIGVPQGSILAPTLFLVFINDMLNLPLSSTAYAYADDTVFICHQKDPQSLEQHCRGDLGVIQEWCYNNRMTINIKKSHYLVFGNAKHKFDLKFSNTTLLQSSTTKLLGFTISDSMSFDNHIELIKTKIQKNTNLLQLCRTFLTTQSARQFYFQFIHCHIINGIQFFLNISPKYQLDSLYVYQKAALRIIANIHYNPVQLSNTFFLCRTLKILPLPSLLNIF